ncbi:hypothetical protein H311_00634 [Anncaliia algerae PRA109]|nr:hypothetical protein H311_00634 [Anncaliia algerae PRA109]
MPSSKIYTDCFNAYGTACLNLKLEHFTVNHKGNFINSQANVHTNSIEGLNNGMKRLIRPRNRVKKYKWIVVLLHLASKEQEKYF